MKTRDGLGMRSHLPRHLSTLHFLFVIVVRKTDGHIITWENKDTHTDSHTTDISRLWTEIGNTFQTVDLFFFFRSIYQKIREYEVLDRRKTVTALRAGEDRAILLGLSMVFLSVMMYFVLGITILRSYSDR